MNKMKSCPDCSKSLKISENRCTCGWSESDNPAQSATDHRCQFRDLGKRCEELGMMSHSSKGQWYCKEHYHQMRNNRLRDAENRDIQKNDKSRIDWRWGMQSMEHNE